VQQTQGFEILAVVMCGRTLAAYWSLARRRDQDLLASRRKTIERYTLNQLEIPPRSRLALSQSCFAAAISRQRIG
jgi:hypothetical protein